VNAIDDPQFPFKNTTGDIFEKNIRATSTTALRRRRPCREVLIPLKLEETKSPANVPSFLFFTCDFRIWHEADVPVFPSGIGSEVEVRSPAVMSTTDAGHVIHGAIPTPIRGCEGNRKLF
jgi:hypothetical protein